MNAQAPHTELQYAVEYESRTLYSRSGGVVGAEHWEGRAIAWPTKAEALEHAAILKPMESARNIQIVEREVGPWRLMQEALFEGHDTPIPPSTHVLIVAGVDADEFSIECSGVHPTCVGWRECDEPHTRRQQEKVLDAAPEPVLLHGIQHVCMESGVCTPTSKCILTEDNAYWLDSIDELELKPGRYPVDFVFEDETVCYLTLIEATS